VTLTDEFDPGVEFPTPLSRGQYFRLVKRMQDELQTDAQTVQDVLHKQGSIVTVKPTSKHAGPMQQRRDVLAGEDNVFEALPTYSYVMRKKLALDPVLKEARGTLPKLPPNAREQVEALIGDVKGRKTIGDKIADAILAPLGQKPFAYSRGVEAARQLTVNLKLGYRPVAALVNRAGGLQHTYTKVGAHYLAAGREWLKTPEGQAALKKHEAQLGIEAAFVAEGKRGPTEEPLWKPLGMFQAAERFNRPEAFGAFHKFAEGELGLSGQEAALYARRATRFAQFTYNTASLPRAMRGPTGRLVFQFKPYLVKELEFISSLRGAEITRYIGGMLAMGGPRAAIYMAKSVPLLGLMGVWDAADDALSQAAPRASRGLPGAAGVDIVPSVVPQLPTGDVWDQLGPTISDLHKLYEDVIAPGLQGEEGSGGRALDWLTGLAPAMMHWSELVEAASSQEGWITDEQGRIEYQPDMADKIKMALGAKPLERSVQQVEERYLRKAEDIQRKNRAHKIDEFMDALEADDGDAVARLREELPEYGVTLEMLRTEARGRKLEPKMRLWRSLSKKTRSEELDRFMEPVEPEEP
jgi:hypothetical protein